MVWETCGSSLWWSLLLPAGRSIWQARPIQAPVPAERWREARGSAGPSRPVAARKVAGRGPGAPRKVKSGGHQRKCIIPVASCWARLAESLVAPGRGGHLVQLPSVGLQAK